MLKPHMYFTVETHFILFKVKMPNRANQSVSQTILKSLAYRVVQPLVESSVVAVLFHLHE